MILTSEQGVTIMADTKVLVITSLVEADDVDLSIVMIARVRGVTMVSPVVMLEGAVVHRNGNPHLVYGDAVAAFTGRDKFDHSITVADCRSGDLQAWE
jgi:hypothetical protein